jgi:uncharacterized membrane protein (Fun14 family)
MGKANEGRQQSEARGQEARPTRRLPRWKKALLVMSVVVMLVGLGLQGYAYAVRPSAPSQAGPRPPGTTGLVSPKGLQPQPPPGETETTDVLPEQTPPSADWYPAVFRLGFSFFVGFCIAYALRTFLKVSLVAVGLVLLALFGLQYAGVIQVNWSAMEGHYHALAGWLVEQTATFRKFITGYLPSSTSAALGLLVGFRKR